MSFFPRALINDPSPSSFHPLFRLLDDFDQYSNTNRHPHRSVMKSFNPKFDVKELGDVYELHGEFPGVDQKDIEIEFTDSQTLTVKGRTERSYTSGTPPAGAIEGAGSAKAIKDTSHQPTVEDADVAEGTPKDTSNDTTDVTVSQDNRPQEPEAKYWVSERSVGEFSRSFSFPVRVDQDRVQASMKNGILSVVVPKAKKIESRKIAIN